VVARLDGEMRAGCVQLVVPECKAKRSTEMTDKEDSVRPLRAEIKQLNVTTPGLGQHRTEAEDNDSAGRSRSEHPRWPI